GQVEAEISEELLYHVERQTTENISRGMLPDEARRAALSELDGVEKVKEECRDMRRAQWLEAALQDCRFGVLSQTARVHPVGACDSGIRRGFSHCDFHCCKRRSLYCTTVSRSGQSRPGFRDLGTRI